MKPKRTRKMPRKNAVVPLCWRSWLCGRSRSWTPGPPGTGSAQRRKMIFSVCSERQWITVNQWMICFPQLVFSILLFFYFETLILVRMQVMALYAFTCRLCRMTSHVRGSRRMQMCKPQMISKNFNLPKIRKKILWPGNFFGEMDG